MTLPLAFDILQSGVRLSLICAVIGLGCAFLLITVILRASPGNERMRQISGAVQEGAKAYLNRQVMTISVIAVVIFLLLFFFKDHATAFGFLLGAFCSLAAGYIGMRIAVLANARVTQAAASQTRTAALRVAFNGGAVTGLLVVGLATVANAPAAIVYPFVLGGISVLGAICGILFVNFGGGKPAGILMGAVGMSALVSAILFWPATHQLFPNGVEIAGKMRSPTDLYFASLIGLLMTGIVVVITNYYTSMHYRPVQKIARASETGHATNIIPGLALRQHATAVPVRFIGHALLLSYNFAGLYGIAVAVMAMLSMAGIIISLDAFGPITDNAGGIAVMSNLPKEVRAATDELDAVGNTMKAVTKGYAIASAGLAALVLFGSYVEELRAHITSSGKTYDFQFSLTEPKVIIGLFIGGLLPFIFTAFSMDAVGKAAGAVVREVRRQIQAKPGILTGADTPDYGTCVDIVTKAALREMIVPALLPLAFVILVAVIPQLGPVVLGGVLVGTIVTGLFVAIAMTSGGGAWDNAKKFIEEGNYGGKGSPAHAAAVTGDTVGDPYKDTAGPAINPMIKVVNIVAILIIPIFF